MGGCRYTAMGAVQKSGPAQLVHVAAHGFG